MTDLSHRSGTGTTFFSGWNLLDDGLISAPLSAPGASVNALNWNRQWRSASGGLTNQVLLELPEITPVNFIGALNVSGISPYSSWEIHRLDYLQELNFDQGNWTVVSGTIPAENWQSGRLVCDTPVTATIRVATPQALDQAQEYLWRYRLARIESGTATVDTGGSTYIDLSTVQSVNGPITYAANSQDQGYLFVGQPITTQSDSIQLVLNNFQGELTGYALLSPTSVEAYPRAYATGFLPGGAPLGTFTPGQPDPFASRPANVYALYPNASNPSGYPPTRAVRLRFLEQGQIALSRLFIGQGLQFERSLDHTIRHQPRTGNRPAQCRGRLSSIPRHQAPAFADLMSQATDSDQFIILDPSRPEETLLNEIHAIVSTQMRSEYHDYHCDITLSKVS